MHFPDGAIPLPRKIGLSRPWRENDVPTAVETAVYPFKALSKRAIPATFRWLRPYQPRIHSRAWRRTRLDVLRRERLKSLLQGLGWLCVYPSQTNFLLCRIETSKALGASAGKQLKLALQQRGILVRYFDKDGLRDCIRVSVGKPEHTDALIGALRDMAGWPGDKVTG